MDFSCYDPMGVGIATVSSVSMAMNILHLVVISKMLSLKDRPYRWILIHIALADIVTAFTLIAVHSCLPIIPLINKLTSGVRPGLVLVTWPQYANYWIFLLASIEQYYGICKPLTHSVSSFVRNLKWILALAWPLSFSYAVFIACMMHIDDSQSATFKKGFEIFDLIVRYAPLFLTAIPLTMMLKELNSMRLRHVTGDERQMRKASIYLITIYLIFTCLSLVDLTITIMRSINRTLISAYVRRLRNAPIAVNGIANTMVYGVRSRAYRRQLIRTFCKKEN